jgi:CRISPR-associated protein Csy1
LNLLNCKPPIWEDQLKPPITHKSLFGRAFYLPAAKEDIDYLRDYLLRFDQLGLSTRAPERWKWIEKWAGSIAEQFLAYVVRIQKLPAGWTGSEGIALKREHQYLLDPFRHDEEFQAARKGVDWQRVVCDDFGSWLNGRLRGKDKKFTPQAEHRRMWAKLLENPLREHNDMVEVERARVEGGKA